MRPPVSAAAGMTVLVGGWGRERVVCASLGVSKFVCRKDHTREVSARSGALQSVFPPSQSTPESRGAFADHVGGDCLAADSSLRAWLRRPRLGACGSRERQYRSAPGATNLAVAALVATNPGRPTVATNRTPFLATNPTIATAFATATAGASAPAIATKHAAASIPSDGGVVAQHHSRIRCNVSIPGTAYRREWGRRGRQLHYFGRCPGHP